MRGGPVVAESGEVGGLVLDRGERLVAAVKPAGSFVVLDRLGLLVWLVVVGAVAVVLASGRVGGWLGVSGLGVFVVVVCVVGAVLVWERLCWWSRWYVVTDRRVVAVGGVLRRVRSEIGVKDVRGVMVVRSAVERVFGVGSVGIGSSATGGYEVVWRLVADAETMADAVRGAVFGGEQAGDEGGGGEEGVGFRGRLVGGGEDGHVGVKVIGIAGGIGAGKSYVAGILAELGCLVVDSDKEAKAALDREDVKRELVAWWGEGVLREDGRVDRKRVAEIVFGDAKERDRLEGLVHPIVRGTRAEMIREAGGRYRAVVVDAPLLFEAGLDAECDAVVFVDVGREERLRRVKETRGWTEEELDRREAAQMDLAQKRARSGFVVLAEGDRADVKEAVERVLVAVEGGATGG